MSKPPVVAIERVHPYGTEPEYPAWKDGCGFVLADPKHGEDRHKEVNEIYVTTLDEAASYVERGFLLRMKSVSGGTTQISAGSLRIVRAPVYDLR
ncbi:hypothetical protein EOD42_25410 [Rhodovarius crocodyli]|uniref:Uncharacterized protein n=1 Tax=Rhodovarius crocodyli TaxID=1979269 RepID=A0A437LVF6_9PROT|nr:hypothetical protein [Rhodovarius crocodyli]RVT89283.1 hypothetical protein EOD42_25410 [Rhodovarius crocodyli]